MSVYLEPQRHPRRTGTPSCQLHLRSYEVSRLTFFADFAMRAAWHMDLVARGPVPLPKKTERWTVPRGPFVHKKTMENFERITYKRVIKIEDAHPRAVDRFLSYLTANCMPGVGMKVNTFEFEEVGAITSALGEEGGSVAKEAVDAAESLNLAAREAKRLLGEAAYQELAEAKDQVENAPDTTESSQPSNAEVEAANQPAEQQSQEGDKQDETPAESNSTKKDDKSN
ncbi:mitochondrial 37S ribosomal protein rsm10 [Savitreella phatthalungensis]